METYDEGGHRQPVVVARRLAASTGARAVMARETPEPYTPESQVPETWASEVMPGRSGSVTRSRSADGSVLSAATSDDPSLRGHAARLASAADALAEFVDHADDVAMHGMIGALDDVLMAIGQAHSAAVGLIDRVQRGRFAPTQLGMTLERYLAGFSRATAYERRAYRRTAEGLRGMPNLRVAFRQGKVGYGEVRSVVDQVRGLDAEQRASIDEPFADERWTATMAADDVVDAVRESAGRHRQRKEDDRALRQIEQRFLTVQPQLDGALTLYGELDAEAGSVLLSAISAAMPPPTADADHTRGALEGPAPDDARPDHASRARQRADALVALAERFLADPSDPGVANSPARRLAGSPARQLAGSPDRRSRTRMQVVVDIATLVGGDTPARVLWDAFGPKPVFTARGARRLASDASLQFLLTDEGEVLGVAAPVAAIPAKVRAAVRARDQGCRFPGCQAPISWCDLHHVVPRERDGPTEIDNLVALCRRHHTAVTQSTWRLDMDSQATVTVRRGRRFASSRPPVTWHAVRAKHGSGYRAKAATTST